MKPESRPSTRLASESTICPECGPRSRLSVDDDGWLACECGLQIEAQDVLVSTRAASEFCDGGVNTTGGGHGDAIGGGRKLTGSTFSGGRDHAGRALGKTWAGRSRMRERMDRRSRLTMEGTPARRATMRLIRENTQETDQLRREALYNLSKGWPEPKDRPADFRTTAAAGHPFGKPASAAACILVAAERLGIRAPVRVLVTSLFDMDEMSLRDAQGYITRSIKCLRSHLGKTAHREATGNRLDAVLNAAFDRDARLGPIFERVRSFCRFWAEYKRPRVLDAPKTYAACAAYEIGKRFGLGLTLEAVETAFDTSQGFRTHSGEVQDLLEFVENHPEVMS